MTGPNWEEDREVLYNDFYQGTIFWETYEYTQPTSVENEIYWGQMSDANDFQEFSYDVSKQDPYTESIDLSQINSVPFTMYLAEEDQYCALHKQKPFFKQMEAISTFKVIPDADHFFWRWSLDDEYIQDLIGELQVE